jgi:hypothetical protein
MQSLVLPALVPWHDFFSLLGEAAATMTGLLFVAASVGSGIFSANRPGAVRMFLSSSVVHFACILTVCMIALAPIPNAALLGAMIAACGGFGLIYCGLALRDLARTGRVAAVDWEDRSWYCLFPVIGYLLETGAGVALARKAEAGGAVLALGLVILLLSAIHNAWDITVWSITRPRE